jgi:hypothetical protein
MKILVKKESPVFTSGISMEEHKAKMTRIYEAKVRPQIEARKMNRSKSVELTAVQKAHLSCHSPI